MQIGPEVHPASYQKGIGILASEVKRAGREANCVSPSGSGVKIREALFTFVTSAMSFSLLSTRATARVCVYKILNGGIGKEKGCWETCA